MAHHTPCLDHAWCLVLQTIRILTAILCGYLKLLQVNLRAHKACFNLTQQSLPSGRFPVLEAHTSADGVSA